MSYILTEAVFPQCLALSLNRPEKCNALTIPLLKEFCDILENTDSSSYRILILKGEGNTFCSGLDLKENLEKEKQEESARLMARALELLYSTPLITIAAVHGAAVAGGAGLMTACDLAIASYDTKIGYPETRRGLVAGLVMTFLLRQLSERHVRELLLLGELITSERAMDIGLINAIVEKEKLLDKAILMAKSILKGAPNATILSKRLIDESHPFSINQDLKQALGYHIQCRESDEALEGIASHFEKRQAHWAKGALVFNKN